MGITNGRVYQLLNTPTSPYFITPQYLVLLLFASRHRPHFTNKALFTDAWKQELVASITPINTIACGCYAIQSHTDENELQTYSLFMYGSKSQIGSQYIEMTKIFQPNDELDSDSDEGY